MKYQSQELTRQLTVAPIGLYTNDLKNLGSERGEHDQQDTLDTHDIFLSSVSGISFTSGFFVVRSKRL